MNVASEIRTLQKMTVDELRAKYVEHFGEANRSRNKPFLRRKIATRLQTLAEGGLSEKARRRAAELAADAEVRVRPPKGGWENRPDDPATIHRFRPTDDRRLPPPGSVLSRKFRGQTFHVRVLENGFELDGTVYRSLTAATRAITGSHWNGFDFFSIGQNGERP